MVAVAQRLRRQVVALKIEGSIPSSHPKPDKKRSSKYQITIIKSSNSHCGGYHEDHQDPKLGIAKANNGTIPTKVQSFRQ
jgi:hypothetical protein